MMYWCQEARAKTTLFVGLSDLTRFHFVVYRLSVDRSCSKLLKANPAEVAERLKAAVC
jgi:hypothetical protein